jgi:hypothetical protein
VASKFFQKLSCPVASIYFCRQQFLILQSLIFEVELGLEEFVIEEHFMFFLVPVTSIHGYRKQNYCCYNSNQDSCITLHSSQHVDVVLGFVIVILEVGICITLRSSQHVDVVLGFGIGIGISEVDVMVIFDQRAEVKNKN